MSGLWTGHCSSTAIGNILYAQALFTSSLYFKLFPVQLSYDAKCHPELLFLLYLFSIGDQEERSLIMSEFGFFLSFWHSVMGSGAIDWILILKRL